MKSIVIHQHRHHLRQRLRSLARCLLHSRDRTRCRINPAPDELLEKTIVAHEGFVFARMGDGMAAASVSLGVAQLVGIPFGARADARAAIGSVVVDLTPGARLPRECTWRWRLAR